ncbi:hypothetical protein [Paraburkholderia adhaesiva]|uniref:hypothetical protein n=1 Tax=Paraburkholderia adhaesiva TaxID=2883244 RepID=UPI001F2E7ABE|nr:hypothetical protein [Paraburkholderia adhaesiva]
MLRWYADDPLALRCSRHAQPFVIAETRVRLAQPDAIFHWLDPALAERSSRLGELRTNTWFQPCRLTGRMHLIESMSAWARHKACSRCAPVKTALRPPARR